MACYNDSFYDAQSLGSKSSAEQILPAVFSLFKPKSVIDIGCGIGTWLSVARAYGIDTITGIDGDYINPQRLYIPPEQFIPLNLEKQRIAEAWRNSAAPTFDLAMTLEVAEHLSFERAPSFIEDITKLSDVILFAAAVPFQGGENHINEQWPEFWELLFRQRGYRCYDILRQQFWNDPRVEWWYAQNSFLYVKAGSPQEALLTSQPQTGNLARVHPKNYLAQILVWYRTHRVKAEAEELADYTALAQAALQGECKELPPLQAITRAATHPDAADIFPHTRMSVSWPEETIQKLHEENLRLKQELAQNERLSSHADWLSLGNEARPPHLAGLAPSTSSNYERAIQLERNDVLIRHIEQLTRLITHTHKALGISSRLRKRSYIPKILRRFIPGQSDTHKLQAKHLPPSSEAISDLVQFMQQQPTGSPTDLKAAQRIWTNFVKQANLPYLQHLTAHDQQSGPARFFILVGGGGLGDILMVTPLIAALKKKFAPCEIVVGYEPTIGQEALARNPDIDGILTAKWGAMHEAMLALQQLDIFDAIVYVRCFIPHFSLCYNSRLHTRSDTDLFSFNASATNVLLPYSTNLGISILDNQIRKHYLDIFGAVTNLPINRHSPLKFYPDPKAAEAAALLINRAAPYVTVRDGANPQDYAVALDHGVTRTTKQLGSSRWASLLAEIQQQGMKTVQVGSLAEPLLDNIDIDLRGKTTLSELYFVMQKATVHLDTEGGLAHFARAAAVPTVVLFGPTSSSFFGYPGNLNIANDNCRECWYSHDEWVYKCMQGDSEPRCFGHSSHTDISHYILQQAQQRQTQFTASVDQLPATS